MREPVSPARAAARAILFIFMAASGVAAALTLMGHLRLGLYVCGGAVAVNLLILLLGGYVVAASRPPDDA